MADSNVTDQANNPPASPKKDEPSSPSSPTSAKNVTFPRPLSEDSDKAKKMTPTERIRTESTGTTGSTSPHVLRSDSTSSARRSRLQRGFSSESHGGVHRQFSRQDSTRSRTRRPSLSIGHADSIPFHLEKPTEVDKSQVPWWTSKRLILSFICFIGFFFLYSLRVNLSTAIVCMTR